MTTWASERAVALVLALSLVAGAAAAEPTPQEKETARKLVKAGRAKKQAGDAKGALDDFKAAHSIMGVPTTGIELGKAQIEAKQWVEARDTLLAVSRTSPAPGESPLFAKARAEAKALAKELEPKIPQLTLDLEHAPSGARVLVNGVEVPAAALAAPLAQNPGRVSVRATLDGREVKAEVELAEGQSRTLSLDLAKLAAPEKKPQPRPSAAAGTSPWVYVGFGVAGAGVLVGSVSGGVALSKASAAKEDCVDDRCPPSTHDDIDSGRTWGTVSTVSFIVAAVGAGVGGYALWSSKPEKSRVEAWVAPASAGVRGKF